MTTLVDIIAVILAFALLLIACDCLVQWHHERQQARRLKREIQRLADTWEARGDKGPAKVLQMRRGE